MPYRNRSLFKSGILALWAGNALIAAQANPAATAGELLSLLDRSGSEPVALKSDDGRKIVIVAPKLGGRVMSMTASGLEGTTNVYLNPKQIQAGFTAKTGLAAKEGWNNFGGADRLWFAPEGGKFGFFFDPAQAQVWSNYRIGPACQSTRYRVIPSKSGAKTVAFSAPVQLTNYAGRKVELEVTREVTLLENCPYLPAGNNTAGFVGFQTTTWAKNTGAEALTKDLTPLALWSIGQFKAGKHVIVVLPFRTGPDAESGAPVSTGYFRDFLTVAPDDPRLARQWKIDRNCVLIAANGMLQLKLELLRRRSTGMIAAIDLEQNTMTLVNFPVLPGRPYAASYFLPWIGDNLDGGVASAYCSEGATGTENPAIYELETCSPILELQPNEQASFETRTYSLHADREELFKICARYLNVDGRTLVEFDAQSR